MSNHQNNQDGMDLDSDNFRQQVQREITEKYHGNVENTVRTPHSSQIAHVVQVLDGKSHTTTDPDLMEIQTPIPSETNAENAGKLIESTAESAKKKKPRKKELRGLLQPLLPAPHRFEVMESQKLPAFSSLDANLFSIEFPGYVKDNVESMQKFINMCGGMSAIVKAYEVSMVGKQGSIELRYRPDNPFVHPIIGDVLKTTNLLVKIVRRRRKGATEWQQHVELEGIVSKTCRFRTFGDFQYLPQHSWNIPKLREAMQNLNVDEVEKMAFVSDDVNTHADNPANHSVEAGIEAHMNTLTALSNKNRMKEAALPHNNPDHLRLIPPPTFSRIEFPQVYDYKQAGVAALTVEDSLNAMDEEEAVIPQARKQRMYMAKFDYKSKDVPTAPPPEAIDLAQTIPDAVKDYFKNMFNKRPIWTRLAMLNSIPAPIRPKIKILLPIAAYFISSGPFRECWVRYGYDPRAHPESAIYQVLDVRNVKSGFEDRKLARGKRNLDGRGAVPINQNQPQEKPKRKRKKKGEHTDYEVEKWDTKDILTTHIFDGQTFNETAFYQLCDLTDPTLAQMVNDKSRRKTTWDEKDGWIPKSYVDEIREVLRHTIGITKGDISPSEEAKIPVKRTPKKRPPVEQLKEEDSDDVFETLEHSDDE